MVVDTSAIIALLFREPEGSGFFDILVRETRLAISAVTLLETSVVAAGRKRGTVAAAVTEIDNLILRFSIEIVAADADGARAAREAYFRYGKGYHPAALNLADCFSYSLAKARNETLLF